MSHIHPFILLLGAQEVEVAVQKHGIRRRIMITMLGKLRITTITCRMLAIITT